MIQRDLLDLPGSPRYSLSGIRSGDVVSSSVKSNTIHEDEIENAPLGLNFRECYDIKKIKPSQEYLELYKTTREELKDLGIPFSY